ncbi:TadE family protein [Streptomyces sp. NPDC001478]
MTLLRTDRPPTAADSGSADIGRDTGTRRGRKRGDRGQSAIEFVGTLPAILVTLAVMWQAGLVCYTWILAGNAADKGVRAAAVAEYGSWQACVRAAREDVPGAWDVVVRDCQADPSGLVNAKVEVQVPLLFPGAYDLPWHATGTAKAKKETGGFGW